MKSHVKLKERNGTTHKISNSKCFVSKIQSNCTFEMMRRSPFVHKQAYDHLEYTNMKRSLFILKHIKL